MTAVVIVAHGAPWLALSSLGALIALGVLTAHLGAFRPKAKRMIGAAVVAATLSTMGATTVRAEDEVVFSDPCQKYTPSDAMYWILGCFWP